MIQLNIDCKNINYYSYSIVPLGSNKVEDVDDIENNNSPKDNNDNNNNSPKDINNNNDVDLNLS